MKKILLACPLLLFCLFGFSQDVATPKFMHVTVDGSINDWGSLNFYDDQTQLNFGLANDSNNIYLCFQTMNDAAQMKILRAGMKITLNTKGKPKHEALITFPLPPDKHEPVADSSHTENQNGSGNVFNKETFRENFMTHHNVMQVAGFVHENGAVPVNDSNIHVAVNWDTLSNLVYEISIAKNDFFGDDFSTKNLNDEITLNVEVNGIAHAENQTTHAYHGGGFQSGDGGMHGGGSMHGYGGRRGGNQANNGDQQNVPSTNNNVALSSKASFKQKFVLNSGFN